MRLRLRPRSAASPLRGTLPLPRSRRAVADTALPAFALRSRARPSLHAPVRLPARALAPKLPPLLAPTIFRGARSLFLLRSGGQRVPRCLLALCRRPLALCPSLCSLRSHGGGQSAPPSCCMAQSLWSRLARPARLPTDSQQYYPYGLPTRALAPKLPPLLAPTIFRGARSLFLLRSGGQRVPRCLLALCRRPLALCPSLCSLRSHGGGQSAPPSCCMAQSLWSRLARPAR